MIVTTTITLNEYDLAVLSIADDYLKITSKANALSGENTWFGHNGSDSPYGAAMNMAKDLAEHVLGREIGLVAIQEALSCGETIIWVCNNRAEQLLPKPPSGG